jgi:hypothetical protein
VIVPGVGGVVAGGEENLVHPLTVVAAELRTFRNASWPPWLRRFSEFHQCTIMGGTKFVTFYTYTRGLFSFIRHSPVAVKVDPSRLRQPTPLGDHIGQFPPPQARRR